MRRSIDVDEYDMHDLLWRGVLVVDMTCIH